MTTATMNCFYVEQVRDITVVCFAVGRLEEDNYEQVSEELLEFVTLATASGPVQLVVELSYVRRIDELGAAMLVALNDSIRDAGGTVTFCRLSPTVQRTIHELGLSGEFDIRATRGEAVWAF